MLITNSQFRKLWLAQVVSQLGDWFSSIALYTLILTLTGSARAVGLFIGAQFLPAALAGYWTGPLTDRMGRRKLMLIADLGRAGLALCYLAVDRPERVSWIYGITVAMVVLQAVFEPARKAALPDIVGREEMVLANAISGATWSSVLALGAAVGGIVAGIFGHQVAFLLNAVSFLLSAYFVSGLHFSSDHSKTLRIKASWGECFRYLRQHPRIGAYAMSKMLWCCGGGISLVLTLYGREIFPLSAPGGEVGAISIGLFYAFRGLGAGFGPFLAYRVRGQNQRALAAALVPGFLVGGLGYLLLAYTHTISLALLCVLLAHLGGATQWVFSTSLLQLSLKEEVRGRVFALEYTGLNLAVALSSYLVGQARDHGWSIPRLSEVMALILIMGGLVLAVAIRCTPPEASWEDDE